MDYQVILSPTARHDLRRAVRWISVDAPDHALRYGRLLVSRTKVLAQFPELGRVVPEFGNPAIREIIVRSYRIVYRVRHAEGRVEIIRYWHGARGTPEIPEV